MNRITTERHWALPVLALALLVLAGCKDDKQAIIETPGPKVESEKVTIPPHAPQASAFQVETVAARKISTTRFTGRLIWNDDSTVRVFSPVAGRVNSILANPGQHIAAGDSLAKIASPDFGQAQADTRKALADLKQAEKSLSRIKDLFEHGAAAQKDLESAEADYTRAVSEKDRTAARLILYGGDASTIDQIFPLKAPIAGFVVEKNINPGLEVRPDAMMSNVPQYAQPLFVISDPSTLWLQLDVAESDMARFKPGQKLTVSTRACPDKAFAGKIEFVGDSIDPSTRTARVRAVVENPDKLLKAEMYVTAEVNLEEKEKTSIAISSKAVFLKDNQHFIFVESAPGQFERRSVKVGDETSGRVSIEEGLAPGQKVVTEGTLLLQALLEGDKS